MNTNELWSALEDLRIGLSDQSSLLWELIGTIPRSNSGGGFLRAKLESCHTNLLNLIHDIRGAEDICNGIEYAIDETCKCGKCKTLTMTACELRAVAEEMFNRNKKGLEELKKATEPK